MYVLCMYNVCMYNVCMYVSMHVYMYVCMYVCMYAVAAFRFEDLRSWVVLDSDRIAFCFGSTKTIFIRSFKISGYVLK